MADRAAPQGDPFRAWLEASRAFLAAGPPDEPVRARCDALFAAWRRFADTYAEAGSAAAGPAAEAGTSGGPFDPLAWTDAASAGGLGDLWRWFGAGAAAGWQTEREALLGSREWAAYALALGRHQAVMAEAWLAAFRRFSEALAAEQRGAGPPSWETIRACWQEAADLELARAMRSDAFLAAQRELIRARLDCTRLIRSRLERLGEVLGLATRAEIDELAQRVHRLAREVRALREAREASG
jgi:hypothetical protein